MRIRFSLRTLLVSVAVVVVAIETLYWIPKHQTLMLNDAYVGYYRGLGLTEGSGYFGHNWFRVVVHEDTDGYWEVDVNGLGYNDYRGYYGNGTLREQGQCFVEENGSGYDIAPQRHDLLNAKYFDPDGNLISEVKNKTGKQILCYPDGQPSWELDLVDGKYAHVKMWHTNGQLFHESGYRDGKQHGISVGYYPSGQLKHHGEYSSDGERIGVWIRYTEDGTIESETDYDDEGEP